MFEGVAQERFYFVHSYAVRRWELERSAALSRRSSHGRDTTTTRFVAAVENGPLWATQFHPEKSGDAGAKLLANWVQQL